MRDTELAVLDSLSESRLPPSAQAQTPDEFEGGQMKQCFRALELREFPLSTVFSTPNQPEMLGEDIP